MPSPLGFTGAWLDRAVQAGLAREDMIAVTRAAHFVQPDNRDI